MGWEIQINVQGIVSSWGFGSQLCKYLTPSGTKHVVNQMNRWAMGPEDDREGFTKVIVWPGCGRRRFLIGG